MAEAPFPIFKKNGNLILNKRDVTQICIDDFALRKRKFYGTLMIDIDTHRIIDMIASRDYDAVKQWLQTYPNIRLVSRDGSITCHNAITEAHPDAIQISDQFHLLKNLSSYSKEFLKKELPPQIQITLPNTDITVPEPLMPISKAHANRKLILKEKYDRIEPLLRSGCSKTDICRSLNMDIRVYNKLISMDKDTINMLFRTNLMTIHEEKVQQKQNRIIEVRDLKKSGLSKREISRRTKLSFKTVQRYLEPHFDPVHASYGKKKGSSLTPYIAEIQQMLELGISGTHIEATIRQSGYAGSSSNLRHYISNWKRQKKYDSDHLALPTSAIATVDRRDLFRLLYHPLNQINAITQDQYDLICTQYPRFKDIHNLLWEFKAIFVKKNIADLDAWMIKAKALSIREINSFIEGLLRDWDAVRNAIIFSYSNGLAEGSVNKIKVIKRIMYGRCDFKTLKLKILYLEKLRHFN
ncbi:MAG: ISL3 family transposase [Hungatella sp.]|nr:ISL3 family transposase [Hungatella sp.]